MNETLINNTINNIETMVSSKPVDNSFVDKGVSGFENVLDKTVKTLGDVKEQFSIISSDDMVNFKEILQEATDEVNVETSLDLTLARDIQEVISQLQGALPASNADEDEEENVVDVEAESGACIQLNNQADFELIDNNVLKTDKIAETPLNSLYKSLVKETENIETSDSELEIDEDVLKELNIESIKAEVEDGSDGADLMNNQSPQEQAVKALMNHDGTNFESKIQQVQAPNQTTASKVPTEVSPSKIIEQVTKQLEGMQNTSKVSIVLNPESLGKVTIELVKSPEGLSAQFTTMTSEAKEILMKGLDGLKEALSSQGVGVDNVSVKLNETQKGEYNSDWTDKEGSRGGNKEQNNSNKDEKDKKAFEKMMEEQVAG